MGRKKYEKNIYKDDERNLYYVTLYYGTDQNGKKIKKTKTTTSIKEARKMRNEHNKKRAAEELVMPVDDTLIKYVSDYIDYKALSKAETTIYGYRVILNKHLAPYFKTAKLQTITAQHLQSYIVAKTQEGLSMATIKKHIDLLKSVFQDACKKDILAKNPVDRIEPLSPPKADIKCLNASELVIVLESLKDTTLECPVRLAGCLGLRRGEVLGLKWSDIDFEKAELTVARSRTQVGNTNVEKAPKTERSKRTLTLSPTLIDALKHQKAWQDEKRASKHYFEENDYVVTTSTGKPYDCTYLSTCFSEHISKLGFKDIHFHSLRHTFASIANEAGTSMSDISSALGHTNINVTSSIYTHEFSPVKSKAVNAVAESLAQAKAPASA